MRWTMVIDAVALAGLSLTTWGFLDLGTRCELGPGLALLWSGAWLLGGALWTAAAIRPRRPPALRHRNTTGG